MRVAYLACFWVAVAICLAFTIVYEIFLRKNRTKPIEWLNKQRLNIFAIVAFLFAATVVCYILQ